MEEMAEEVILQRLLRQMKSTVFVGIEPHWATAASELHSCIVWLHEVEKK